MTRMIDAVAARPTAQRILIAAALGLAGLFLVGLAAGVVVGTIERGAMPSRLWVAILGLVALPLGPLAIYWAWRIAAPPQSASGYEKRYWRTWFLMVLISLPIGVILAMNASPDDIRNFNPFSSAPISPINALMLTLVITGACVAILVLYHRAIDDHEERAYLWGSQIAYYFLVLAFPAWWLLERGGIVLPITTMGVLAAILVSCFVQAAVWAWLKFR